MPINPTQVTAAVLAASPDLVGQDWFRIAGVVGIATVGWATQPGNLVLSGVTLGSSTFGQIPLGKLIIPPIAEPVYSSAVLHGLSGLISPSMARGIGVGVGAAFSATAAYVSVSVGVGSGLDISKVTTVNHATLVALFFATFASFGMTGVNIPRMASAYGIGIANQMLLGTGFGSVIPGVVVPVPAGGFSNSLRIS